MYAVIKSGGKQHRVTTGEVVKLEKLEVPEGQSVEFNEVLMLGDEQNVQNLQIGRPFLEGATVTAEVIEHGRSKKVTIIKFNRRKHYKRRAGHRQSYTKVRITAIPGGI